MAVDYRASVRSADTSAYTARIYQSDHGLTVTVKPGHAVAMNGYLGEPIFRLDRAGLWVNAASPTAVVVGLVGKNARVTASTPHWRLQRGRRSVTWHDARVQGLPSGVDHGAWGVPLIVDGRPARLAGVLRRFPDPSLVLWLGMLVCVLAAGASPLLLHRRDLAARAAIAMALATAAAAAVIELAMAFDTYASPGTWIEAADSIVFIAVGLFFVVRGPESAHVGAAIWIGLVGLAIGLLNGAALLHPIVLAVAPGTVVRLAVVTATGAGASACLLGCLYYADAGAPSLATELDRVFSNSVSRD